MTAPRIITSRIDLGPRVVWQAADEARGWHSSPIGDGPTEAAAVADLQSMLNAMAAPVWEFDSRREAAWPVSA